MLRSQPAQEVPVVDAVLRGVRDERRGRVYFAARILNRVKPGNQAWIALMVLAHSDGAPTERDAICKSLSTNDRQDKKNVARDAIRHLRDLLRDEGIDANTLVETLGGGKWRLNAIVRFIADDVAPIEWPRRGHDMATDFSLDAFHNVPSSAMVAASS